MNEIKGSPYPPKEEILKAIRIRKAIDGLGQGAEVFKPLLKPSRYKAVYGGRGSGKSHEFAELMVLRALTTKGLRAVGIREIQKSINLSVKQLIVDKIKKWELEDLFEILDTRINTPGDGYIVFQGMQNHTSDSIKSLEGFDIAWVEEAQSLSQRSLTLLRPTMRKEGSEIWFSWNPDKPTDPVDDFFRGAKAPEGSIVFKANYNDNPFFPDVLKEEMEYDKKRDVEKYLHVWEGEYQTNSDSRVFRNYFVEEFDTPHDARFLFGADWGFAIDPTTLVRMWIGRFENGVAINDPKGRNLFVDYEASKVNLPIDQTPAFFRKVPKSSEWAIRADSARPETIDYMKRNGFPLMVRSTKGKGSVNEGVEFIKSYEVVIHPRCKTTEKEFIYYSYKIDPKTEEVLPQLKDDNNHIIDAIRYGLELVRKAQRGKGRVSSHGPIIIE